MFGDAPKTAKRKRKATPSTVDEVQTKKKKSEADADAPIMDIDTFDADSLLEALDNSFIIENIEVVPEETGTAAAAANSTNREVATTTSPPPAAPEPTTKSTSPVVPEPTTKSTSPVVPGPKTKSPSPVVPEPKTKAPSTAFPGPWRASSLPSLLDDCVHSVDASAIELQAEYESLDDENPNDPHHRFMTADEVVRGEFSSEGFGSHPIEYNISFEFGGNFELSSEDEEPELVTLDEDDEIEEEDNIETVAEPAVTETVPEKASFSISPSPTEAENGDHQLEKLNCDNKENTLDLPASNEDERKEENEARPNEASGSGADLSSSSLPVISNDTLKIVLSADTTATVENILSDLQNPNNDANEEVTHPQNTDEHEANVNQDGAESQEVQL